MIRHSPFVVSDSEKSIRRGRMRSRVFESRTARSPSARSSGFSLLELVVAVAVFAVVAAAAYGSLAAIARTRGALAAQQERFAQVQRALSVLADDLRQSAGRSVRGNDGKPLPALAGSPQALEFTRVGFANPLAEARSNLQRVAFAFEAGNLREGRYAVLDRAPNSVPAWRDLLPRAGQWRVRYLGCDRVWREAWPPAESLPCQPGIDANAQLPRAVEFRIAPPEFGDIRRIVELPAPAPSCISGNAPPC